MFGNSNRPDKRISILLDELSIDYDIDENGDFIASFMVGKRRSQRVFINSDTRSIGDLEIRKIHSIAYRSDAPLSRKVANLLLEINHRSMLGAWQLMATEDGFDAAYNAQIAADTDAMTLLTAIKAVVESADSIENYLTGEDVF